MPTVYDVTTFTSPSGTSPYTDIGQVINEIMADIRAAQLTQSTRPGAVIYIPPGHYNLLTGVVIDRSFIQIKGSGHGFMSEAIRDDDGHNTSLWWEYQPGGSHIRVMNTNTVAFSVNRSGDPDVYGRLNGIEFRDFCIDGVTATRPYTPGNNKVGISFDTPNDSVRVEGMGFVYLAIAVRLNAADASYTVNNFIAECGWGVQVIGAPLVPRIQDNTIVCPWAGNSILIDGGNGALITGNSLIWHGSIRLVGHKRASITGNRLSSAWSGQLEFDNNCEQNLVSGNAFYREQRGPIDSSGPHDDLFGMMHLRGNGHTVTGNHLSFNNGNTPITPSGQPPTFILAASGSDDVISNNHIITSTAGKVVLDASVVNLKLIYTTYGSGQLQAYPGANYAVVHLP